MNTATIQLRIQEAQSKLPEANGDLSELLAELEFRDRFIRETEKACGIVRLND
jgi:hypothetical protein